MAKSALQHIRNGLGSQPPQEHAGFGTRPIQYTFTMCRHLTLLFVVSLTLTSAVARDSALSHLGAANKLLDREQFSEAADEFQKALDLDRGLLAARWDLAVCRFELRQYEPAKKLLSELLNHASTNAMAHYYSGRIDLVEENIPSAIAHFRSIPSAHPFRDERYYMGRAYFKTSRWESCVKMLQAYIRQNPRDFRSHQLLGRAFLKLGRKGAAAGEFAETRRLLGYYTEGSEVLQRCGQLLLNNSDEEAWKNCGPQMETDDVDKLASLGMLFGKYGRFEHARAAWERAASLDPESPEIRYDLALTCFHLKDSECARNNAKAAIQARPDFPEANVLYASVLYKLGVDDEALPALRRAHLLNPADASIRELLGNELMLWAEQYAKTGRSAEARVLVTELDGLQPLQRDQEQRKQALRRLLDDGSR
jgi:tetratricopeptide (TPR) repeat protein